MKAEQYGAKIVMQLSMFFCAFISLITPLTIILNTKLCFIFFVSLQGLGQVSPENYRLHPTKTYFILDLPQRFRGALYPHFTCLHRSGYPCSNEAYYFPRALEVFPHLLPFFFAVRTFPCFHFHPAGLHFGSAIGIPIIKWLSNTRWFAGYVLSAFLGFIWVLSSIFFMRIWRPRRRLSMTSRRNLHLLFGKIEVSERGVVSADNRLRNKVRLNFFFLQPSISDIVF